MQDLEGPESDVRGGKKRLFIKVPFISTKKSINNLDISPELIW